MAPWYFSLVSFVAVAGCVICGLGGSCPWLLAMAVALGTWLFAMAFGHVRYALRVVLLVVVPVIRSFV